VNIYYQNAIIMGNIRNIYVLLLLQGIYSQFAQAVVLRELAARFSGIEIAFAAALSSIIVWTAAGAFFGRLIKTPASPQSLSILLIMLSPVSAVASLLYAACGHPFLSAGYELAYSLDEIILFSSVMTLPFGIVNGMIFGHMSAIAKNEKAGLLYASDAIGDTAGGLIFSLVLASFAPPFSVIAVSGIALMICSLVFLRNPGRLAPVVSALAIPAVLSAAFLDGQISRIKWKQILPSFTHEQTVETAYGRVDILKSVSHAAKAVYFEGSLCGTVPPDKELAIPLAAFSLSETGGENLEILLVTSVFNPLISIFCGADSVSRIDLVCPDRRLFEISRNLNAVPSQSGKLNLKYGDAGAYMEKSAAKYDLVIVLDSEPDSISGNRFFTKEFYRLVKGRLKDGGVLVTSMPSTGGYSGEKTRIFNAIITSTLKTSFRNAAVLPGEEKIVAASDSERLTANFAELDRRAERILKGMAGFVPGILSAAFSQSEQRTEAEQIEAAGENCGINSDASPALPMHYLKLRSRIISGDFESPGICASAIEWISGKLGMLLAIFSAIYVFVLVFRMKSHGHRFSIGFSSFENGFYAMGVNIMLLFIYQNRCGMLYKDIAAMAAVFIAGTAVGACCGRGRRKTNFAALALSAVVPAAGMALTQVPVFLIMPAVMILLFAAGVSVGAAYSLLIEKTSKTADTSSLWAYEMAGGALGGIAFSLFLMPLAGLAVCVLVLTFMRLYPIILSMKNISMYNTRKPA
jgi:spermidine synthase